MAEQSTDLIQAEIDKAIALERALTQQITQIKAAQLQIDNTWDAVKDAMISYNVKSIKGDYGSITIAERITYETTDDLPKKYYKLVPDVKKIGTYHALTGETPKGATAKVTRYLTKRLK